MIRALALLCCLATPALADQSTLCIDIAIPKGAIAAHDGKWIELNQDQWEFLRGIYLMNPDTPPGLPLGDRAVLAQVGTDKGGVVFWIDGARACTPMPIPETLIDMLSDVQARVISHEPSN